MQKILAFINTHIYDFFIPLTALGVLRIVVCLAQLKRTAAIREQKGIYHAVREHYAEIGAWIGILICCGLTLALPKLWYLGLALAVVLGIIGGKLGGQKGAELDSIYREVAQELKQEAEAEAARENAAHTLDADTAGRIESGTTEPSENTEDKGETENG